MSNKEIIFNTGPQRIRSKVAVGVYYTKHSFDEYKLLDQLYEAFKVVEDDQWKFIITRDYCEDDYILTQVLVDCYISVDVYSNKLNIDTSYALIKPSIWCFNERSFALYSVLKFQESDYKKGILLTNFSDKQLKDATIRVKRNNPPKVIDKTADNQLVSYLPAISRGVTQLPNENSSVTVLPSNEKVFQKKKEKKAMKDKQLEKLSQYMNEFDSIESENLALTKDLKDKLFILQRNIRNYEYNYDHSSNPQKLEEIRSYYKRYSKLKKK